MIRLANFFPQFLLTLTLLTFGSRHLPTVAEPAPVFRPHLDSIQAELPRGLTLRLPAEIIFANHSDINPNRLILKRFGSDYPHQYSVSLFTCDQGIYSCLIASFTVQRADSAPALEELMRHHDQGEPITLNGNYQGVLIQGYLLDGFKQDPSSSFSSLMWQQNYMIYRVSFPASERQSLLYMGVSMAQEAPIYPR